MKTKAAAIREKVMKILLSACGFTALLFVVIITGFLIASGIPQTVDKVALGCKS